MTRSGEALLPKPGTYKLDPPHTFIEFRARHKVVGIVRGRFDRASGTIVVSEEPAHCRVAVTIEAASLSTQNPLRDADVMGPDFLDAARFPAITYSGEGIRRVDRGWVIDGTLKIRNVSRRVPLEFQFNGAAPVDRGQPERVGFHAAAAVQRAEFDMRRELLAEIGVESPAPDVWIEIDVEALSRAPAGR